MVIVLTQLLLLWLSLFITVDWTSSHADIFYEVQVQYVQW